MDKLIDFTLKEFIRKYCKGLSFVDLPLEENSDRNFSGMGLFVKFKVPNSIKTNHFPFNHTGGQIDLIVNDDIMISTLFYIKDGCLEMIEFYEVTGERWPNQISKIDLG